VKYAFVPFQKYATFSGRARRAEYWQFTLATALISLALTGLDALTGTYSVATGFGFLSGLFSLALIVPFAALYARRFHDFGWSTWWLLILLVPSADCAVRCAVRPAVSRLWLVNLVVADPPRARRQRRVPARPGL